MALNFAPPAGVNMTIVRYEDLCVNEELIAALTLQLNLDFFYNKVTDHCKLSSDPGTGRKEMPRDAQAIIDAATSNTLDRLNTARFSVDSYLAASNTNDIGTTWLETRAMHLNSAVSNLNSHLHARYDRGRTTPKHIQPPAISAEALTDVELFRSPFYHLPHLCLRIWQGTAGIHRLNDNESWLAVSYDAVKRSLFHPAIVDSARPRTAGSVTDSELTQWLTPFVTAEAAALRSREISDLTRNLLSEHLSGNEFHFKHDFTRILSAAMFLNWLGIKHEGIVDTYRNMRATPTWELLESSLAESGLIVDLVSQHPELKRNVAEWYNLVTGSFGMVCDFVDTATYGLLQHPGWISIAREQAHRISDVVTELLRLFPPVTLLMRTVVGGCEISGQQIPDGNLLYLAVGAANRDPNVFDNPDAFDIDRQQLPLFTFGGGNIRCPGEAMARSFAETILAVLFTEFPPLVQGAEFKFSSYSGVPFQHLPMSVNVRFDSQQTEN